MSKREFSKIVSDLLGAHTVFIFDLSSLKPTETVKKAVLRTERRVGADTLNITFYSVAKRSSSSKTYLGSGILGTALDLADMLNSRSFADMDRLIVRTASRTAATVAVPSVGLVLYSTTAVTEGQVRGHELTKLLLDAAEGRGKRSIHDNEIDVKQKDFGKQPKRNKKKKPSRTHKRLQVIYYYGIPQVLCRHCRR